MPALPKFLVLLAIFSLARSGDALINLSLAAGDLVPYSLSEKQDAELPIKITVLITQFTSDTSYAFEAVHGVSQVHVKYIVTS